MATDWRRLHDALCLAGGDDFGVALTRAGMGGSRWRGLAVTRWQPEVRVGNGPYVYVRDVTTERAWSATAAPCGGTVRTWFDAGLARSAREDGALTTTLEIAADPERAIEVRGVGIRNRDDVAHQITLTSYLELALAPAAADAAHPAYSKMFVQTAVEEGVLLAWRRKKDPAEPDVWAAHALVVDGAELAPRQWETDRARFIGRDRSLAHPIAEDRGVRLTDTTGTVLDPAFSLRATLAVAAGETRRAAWVTAVAASREAALALVRRCRTPAACADVFARARTAATKAQSLAEPTAARAAQRLAGALLGVDASWRARPTGAGGAPVLWAKGISGDLPIVVARVHDAAQVPLAAALVAAQQRWRACQLAVDLVVVATATGAARAALDVKLHALAPAAGPGDKAHGALFVLHDDALDPGLRAGLATAACITLDADRGTLAQQLAATGGGLNGQAITWRSAAAPQARGGVPRGLPDASELAFWNGLGGFSADGREYVTLLRDGAATPAPWAHIVANPGFGFLATAAGGGYAWAANSQQNQITPWSNDAVCDPPGAAILLRDVDAGTAWSTTAAPLPAAGATYVARFGPGYARFDASIEDVESELTQCVATADPVQLSRLVLRNVGSRRRRLEIAQAVEWRLGAIGSDPRPTTVVDADRRRSAVFAHNAWRAEFDGTVAFIACATRFASPRSEGTARSATVASITLEPGAEAELVFLLGEGADRAAAEALVDRYRAVPFAHALGASTAAWEDVLSPLQVTTPQRSLDLLVNRWLPYQVLACRVWARTAFYQASGAYGFRDQLQDVAALCLTRPDLARQHLLLAASRQFEAGDVQHWWLPPSGRGVRTRIVDDRLWLPYVVSHYVRATADAAVLDAQAPFLRGDPLQPGQTDSFFLPQPTPRSASLFEHCARAIEASLATGAHGLPLMGTGDWNDGMNRVGAGGHGESVWMAWFLIDVINAFAPIAERRHDPRAAAWRGKVWEFQHALATEAWDGAWYRRAFYDDGAPLGARADAECRIESMAQSWAVISGAGDPARARTAMQALDAELVRPDGGVVALFWPPFDHTQRDPGYIKGYPPGLRENGGQYTHGSIWALIAFALLGQGDKAAELLEIFNPIGKSDSPEKAARYKVEPYVECADVYSVAPHTGRGGWTWYSGSAGWLYRAIVEWVLGLRPRGDRLHVDPCIPHAWDGFRLRWQRGGTTWDIEVRNPGHVCRGVAAIEVDGVKSTDLHAGIALVTDGAVHQVRVTLQQGSNDAHGQV
jgi:cyclic beta-1,2-glucan synthetase